MSLIRPSVIDDIAFHIEEQGMRVVGTTILLPTLGITVSEFALFFGYRGITLWGYLLTLVFCLFAPLRIDDAGILSVFTLVPIFRLVNLGMPVFLELTIYWYPLVYAPVIPAIYLIIRGNESVDLRFAPRTAGRYLLPGLALGVLLGHLEYAVIAPGTLIPEWTVGNVLVIGIVMFGFVGFVEELLFRGLLQRMLQDRVGGVAGLLLASFLFGMMHSAYGTGLEMVFAGVIGLVLGIVYDWTDSILLVTVIHGTLNVVLFAVIPLRGALLPLF